MPDINEQVEKEWKEDTTGAERVESVLETTRTPTSAGEFAERALVSEPMARECLTDLAERGIAETNQDSQTTRWKRDEKHFVDRRIRAVRESHSTDELVEGIQELQQHLQSYQEEYGVDSPEELSRTIDLDEDNWMVPGEWLGTRKNLAIAKAALAVDEAYRLAER